MRVKVGEHTFSASSKLTLPLSVAVLCLGVSSLLGPTSHPHPKGAPPLGCKMPTVSLKRLGEQGASPANHEAGESKL